MVMKSNPKNTARPAKGKTERLDARITVEIKELLARAAALEGNSLTNFVISAATKEARRVVHEMDMIQLSARDQMLLAEALLNPPKPSRKLMEAARKYQEQFMK